MRSQLRSLITLIRLAGLALAALAMWVFAAIADEVLDRETHAFDQSILLGLWKLHQPLLDRIMIGFTILGEPTLLLVLSLSWGAILLFRNHRSEATTIALAGAGAVVLNTWLKNLFGRARPELWERIVDVEASSFPSGHAMISLVIYGVFGYFLVMRFPKWRWVLSVLTGILIAGIGLSRLYLGVHWPTDVIAGYTAGLVWLITCILSLEVWKELRSTVKEPEERFLSSDDSA